MTNLFRNVSIKQVCHVTVIICLVAYVLVSFRTVRDYGLTIDSQDDFAIGLKYLHYFGTGHLDLREDQPAIAGHPMIYSRTNIAEHPYYAYPFANTLSAVTCRLFYETWGLLDPVSAHHIMIPLLLAAFLYVLFRFVRDHWDDVAALLAVLLVLTYPRFFGDSFNNVKDVPETVFFSLTIMAYAEWRLSWRARFLYLAAVGFACAFATKPDVLFAGVILALWEAALCFTRARSPRLVQWRTLLHYGAAALLTFLLAWALYPPLHPWNPNWLNYLEGAVVYMKEIATWPDTPWNTYAPSYVLNASPLLPLVLFGIGFIWLCLHLRGNPLHLLLLIWVLLPVLRHCLPNTNHYDGMRHFLMFVVPFGIVGALGIMTCGRAAERIHRRLRLPVALATGAACLILNLYAIASTHPFESTYFNALIGGLKGAQARDYPYAYDYWVNSYRQVGKWLDANAKPGAHYHAVIGETLLRWSVTRKDLCEVINVNSITDIPPNTYLVVIPRKRWGGLVVQWGMVQKWTFIAQTYPLVYRIKRQGGEIASVYYRP